MATATRSRCIVSTVAVYNLNNGVVDVVGVQRREPLVAAHRTIRTCHRDAAGRNT
jgi:hypothetical protein